MSKYNSYHQRFKTMEERFWDKVNKQTKMDCWEWIGAINSGGYGSFDTGEEITNAHRVAWEMVYGEIPKHDSYHGMCICHICDNKLCVNPKHLFIGTHEDNMKDMSKKGRCKQREQRGENSHFSKLCNEEVLKIRQLYSEGNYTMTAIAEIYNVSRPTIGEIVNCKSWNNL